MTREEVKYTQMIGSEKAKILQYRADIGSVETRRKAATKASPDQLSVWSDTVARLRINVNKAEKKMKEAKQQVAAVAKRSTLMRHKINDERASKLKGRTKQEKRYLKDLKPLMTDFYRQPQSRFMKRLKAKEKVMSRRVQANAKSQVKVLSSIDAEKKVGDLAAKKIMHEGVRDNLKAVDPKSPQLQTERLKLINLRTEKRREVALAAKTGKQVAGIMKAQEADISARLKRVKANLIPERGPTGDKVHAIPAWYENLSTLFRKSTGASIQRAADRNKNIKLMNQVRLENIKANSKIMSTEVTEAGNGS